MAWTSPITFSALAVLTAPQLNTHLRDNLLHICNTQGNLELNAAGPHSIGSTIVEFAHFSVAGTFTPTTGPAALGFQVVSRMQPKSGGNAFGVFINPTLDEFSSGTHPLFASLYVGAPTVTVGAGALSESATVYIDGVSSAGVLNYALLINTGTADGLHIALRNDDIAHGATSVADSNIYATLSKHDATAGGLRVLGLTETNVGLNLEGMTTTETTVKDSTARCIVEVAATTKNGTTVMVPNTNANIFGVRLPGYGTIWFVDKEGDVYRDGSDNTFMADKNGNEYDDAMLALALEDKLKPVPADKKSKTPYTTQDLIDAKLIGSFDPTRGKHAYNEGAGLRLALGGLWKEALRLRELEARVTALEAKP